MYRRCNGEGSVGAGNEATPLPPRFQSTMPAPPTYGDGFRSQTAQVDGSFRGQTSQVADGLRSQTAPQTDGYQTDGFRNQTAYQADGFRSQSARQSDGFRGQTAQIAQPQQPPPPPPSDDGDGSAQACGSDESNDTHEDRGREERHVIHTSISTSSFRDTTARGLLLCDESLNTLAAALSPQDGNRLIVGLAVPDSIVKQARGNHPRDIVEAQYELLRHWRHRNTSSGTDAMYATLLNELQALGRNDMINVIKAVEACNRKLMPKDFGM